MTTLVVATGLFLGVPTPAHANTALGCTFDAANPYRATDGRIYTKLTVRCTSGRWLYWHARVTKDRNNWPDQTVGSSDGVHFFNTGVTYTWYLGGTTTGAGYYFGKLSIQATSLSTAYSDRSANVYFTW